VRHRDRTVGLVVRLIADRQLGSMLWFKEYFCRKIWQKIGIFDSKYRSLDRKRNRNISF
jgi:hypothetical protein